MSCSEQEEFKEFMIENGVLGFFPEGRTLKSGRTSHWYVNWRGVTSDVYLIDELTDYILGCATELADGKIDCFYGVPEGATKTGVITQFKWVKDWIRQPTALKDYPLPMGRATPKEHGDPKDRYFVGEPRGNTVVIEDVTTTGGSLIKSIYQLQELGVPIIAAIGLTNRMEVTPIPGKDLEKTVKDFAAAYEAAAGRPYLEPMSVEQAIRDMGVQYYSLSNAHDLLPEAYRRMQPGEDIARAIEAEFREYGVEPIHLR